MIMAWILSAISFLGGDGPKPVAPPAPAGEAWQLTLREAIRIGLDNCEIVRTVASGAAKDAPIVIARRNADTSVWYFKAAIMAHVRSVEQQYWALSQQQIQHWGREMAVKIGEEILRREKAELEAGRGTGANVAEAQQALENNQLALITATSDLITTERHLRNLLGLPPADNRRIIPVTAPTEAKVEPDWESSLAQMMAGQPDIAQQQVLVRLSELQLILCRNQLLPQLDFNTLSQFNGLGAMLDQSATSVIAKGLLAIAPLGRGVEKSPAQSATPAKCDDFQNQQVGLTQILPMSFGRSHLANTRSSQYQLLRQQAFLNQILHQTTHSLARFFLEVDANYKQFKTAQRLRQAAQMRLESARARYEEGSAGFTIDRLLDAVNQYANAIGQEAQFQASYNTSIVALEEAKGTLFAHDNIVVAEPALEAPAPRPADLAVRLASFDAPRPTIDPKPAARVLGRELWHMSLAQTIATGLANSPIIRAITNDVEPGRLISIAPADRATRAKFEPDLLPHVRSTEQQYWALWYQQEELAAREEAVMLVEAVVRREEAALTEGRGTAADFAEARQALEACNLKLVTAASDLLATERQLRNIIGVPAGENLRIVAETAPTTAEVKPDSKACLDDMERHHPDLMAMSENVKAAEEVETSTKAVVVTGLSQFSGIPPDVGLRSRLVAERARAYYRRQVRDQSEAVGRFVSEVRHCYEGAKAAEETSKAATTRLGQARSNYEARKAGFTVDRVLDAIARHADAVANEAQQKATYNTALAGLAEARGTLLIDRGIKIVEPARKVATPATASHPAKNGVDVDLAVRRTAADSPKEAKPAAKLDDRGATVTYQIKVNSGKRSISLEGTIKSRPSE